MLYVVATPIGNLSDLSPRALETLRSCALIAAEDTRVTRKILARFDIHTPLTSCHKFNERDKGAQIISRMLSEGIDVALVTDAGTPAISDPGTELVRLAAEAGVPVTAVPGPCAAAAALSVSGFPFPEYTFYGFLPREKKDMDVKLNAIARSGRGAVVYESPHRVEALLLRMIDILPNAKICLCADLTKLHETLLRGSPRDVLSAFLADENAEKREYCAVIDPGEAPAEEAPATEEISLEARLVDRVVRGESVKEAVASLAASGVPKKEAYAASLKLKKLFE